MTRKSLLLACASLCAVALAVPAIAAEAPAQAATSAGSSASNTPQASATQLPEVVVTARKRAENIQTVPITITAFTSRQLTQQGINSATDLRTQVPSLSTETTGIFSSWPMWGIRGQRDDSFLLLQAPTVITYFADVPQGHPVGFGEAMYDMASVSVLEGPQGTLFGKNSTGGAVVAEPNRPTDRFGGEVTATYGNHDTQILEGVVNLPINDMFQLRVAGQLHKDDGLMKDLTTGQGLDETNSGSGRVELMFKPTSNFSSLTTYDYYHDTGAPSGVRLFYVNPYSNATNPNGSYLARFQPGLLAEVQAQQTLENGQSGDARWSAGSPFGAGDSADIMHHPLEQRLLNYGITNDSTLTLNDDLKVRNIISGRRDDIYYDADYNSGNYLVDSTASQENLHQLSEEFQVLGKSFDRRLEWVAGLFYMDEAGTEFAGAKNFLTTTQVSGGGRNTTYAIFAQGTYKLTDDLKLTLGARGNHDEVYGYSNGVNLASTSSLEPGRTTPTTCKEGVFTSPPGSVVSFPMTNCILQGSTKFNEPTWTASLEYSLPKTLLPAAEKALVYFTNRRGYRDGGFNMRGTYATCAPTACTTPGGNFGPYQPEFATDYETGFKADWRFGQARLRTNATLYYDTFDNLQRSINVVIPPNPVSQQVIANAAQAHVMGAELQWIFLPDPHWEFSGFYDYTDAKYDRYEAQTTNGAPLNLAGRGFVDTPANKLSLNLAYKTPLPGTLGEASGRVNYTWQDSEILAEQPLANGITATQPAYGLLNFRLDWQNIGGRPIDLGAYVKNALGQYYNVGIADLSNSLGVTLAIPGDPRTFGVDLHYHF